MNTCSAIFVFILCSLCAETFGQVTGGYSYLDKDAEEFIKLKADLVKSNLGGTLSNDSTIKRLEEVQRQVVAGTNYKILGEIEVDGQSQSCCFKAFRSLKDEFSVECADCGCDYPASECFD